MTSSAGRNSPSDVNPAGQLGVTFQKYSRKIFNKKSNAVPIIVTVTLNVLRK